MKASDVMVSNVITVGPEACVQDVADACGQRQRDGLARRIGHLDRRCMTALGCLMMRVTGMGSQRLRFRRGARRTRCGRPRTATSIVCHRILMIRM